MIELTEEQIQAPEGAGAAHPMLVNSKAKETFVSPRSDEYERRKDADYHDTPWTREELQVLAWEMGERSGWEEGAEYDDA